MVAITVERDAGVAPTTKSVTERGEQDKRRCGKPLASLSPRSVLESRMVIVEFVNSEGRAARREGPFWSVRVNGITMEAGGGAIGMLEGGCWRFDGQSGTRVRLLAGACSVRFEGEGDKDTRGPYELVELINGALYTEPGPRLAARFDEHTGRWHSYGDGCSWPGFVVEGLTL